MGQRRATPGTRRMGADEACGVVRRASADELATVLAAVAPRRRAAVFLDMLVLRGSLPQDQARAVTARYRAVLNIFFIMLSSFS